MKYYIRTANLECSENERLYESNFGAEKWETTILHKESRDVFFHYTEVVNVLPSLPPFLTKAT